LRSSCVICARRHRPRATERPCCGAREIMHLRAGKRAARALNVKLQVLDIKNREDVGRAIRAARDTQAQALNVFFSPLLSALHREIITLAAEYGLPAIYQWKEHVEAGGLVSYGPNLAAGSEDRRKPRIQHD